MSWERRLADMADAIRFERMPREVVDLTRTLVLDTLGCALGALGAEPATKVMAAAQRAWPGTGGASLIGTGERASAEVATLVNGALIRYLDFNDIYEGLEPIHPSENIAAALACCEEAGADGKRLIEAIVTGYEAHIRIARAYSFIQRGLHPVSAAGWVAPLIAGKSWGLSPEVMAHGVALSGARCQTLTVISRGEIGMAKATGYAFPSMDGVFSARLAAEGFTGPNNALQWLFDKVQPVAEQAAIETSLDAFGILGVSLKRFAVQFELQSVVEACIELAGEVRGAIDAIEAVDIGTYKKVIDRGADPSKFKPRTRETADHSLPICAALALADGRLVAAQFEEDRWKDEAILSLAARVRPSVDEDLLARFPKGRGARVTVVMRDGQRLSRLVEVPQGDSRRPLSAEHVRAKFMEQAVPAIGEARATRVVEDVARLEQLPSLEPLLALLCPEREKVSA